jgi:hypothetical protein
MRRNRNFSFLFAIQSAQADWIAMRSIRLLRSCPALDRRRPRSASHIVLSGALLALQRSASLRNTARLIAGPQIVPYDVPDIRYGSSSTNKPKLSRLSLKVAQVEMRGFEPLASAVQRRRSPI